MWGGMQSPASYLFTMHESGLVVTNGMEASRHGRHGRHSKHSGEVLGFYTRTGPDMHGSG